MSRFSQGLKSVGRTDAPSVRNAKDAPPVEAVEDRADELANEVTTPPAQQYTAPSRRGKKQVAGYFDPAVRKQLALLALEEDRSQNDLMAEALNMLFERYGKSPIA